MAEGVHQFGNISLGSRGGSNVGQLKVSPAGLVWRKAGSDKRVEVAKKDLAALAWTRLPRGCQLGVKTAGGGMLCFQGFREQDLDAVKEVGASLGSAVKEEVQATSGRNWGDALIDGSSLVFAVDKRPAFRLPLAECSQVQLGKDEVLLEFPVDDTLGGDREDALVEMNFYIPKENAAFATEDDTGPAKAFYNAVMQHADIEVAVGDSIASFENVAVLAPRGRFDVELYGNFMKLVGQTQDYRIQFNHIMRIFLLPKTASPHTLVVLSMDPPIRKGQTYYPHILCQFPTDEELSIELDVSEELLAAKNEKCGGKLTRSLSGGAHDVFARAVRGLSGAKLTKPGAFRTADGSGYALRCSYKADDGYLYPLERAFFYVHKPPMLIAHDDIESVEFMRQGGGVLAASAKTFDLNIRTKQEQEYLFRGIQKGEWTNLFSFTTAKRLRIDNFREAEAGPGGPGRAIDVDDDIDPGLAKMQAQGDLDEDEEEDEDFREGEDGEDEEDDDNSDLSGSDADADEEEAPKKKKRPAEDSEERPARPPKQAKADKPPREPKAPKAPKPPKEPKVGKDGKKKRAKKDPNAPKRGMSAFMLFSNAHRDEVKTENPGIAFGQVGKLLGERWKAVTPEEKAKFEELAAKEKARYERENAAYKAKQAGASGSAPGGGGNGGGDGGESSSLGEESD